MRPDHAAARMRQRPSRRVVLGVGAVLAALVLVVPLLVLSPVRRVVGLDGSSGSNGSGQPANQQLPAGTGASTTGSPGSAAGPEPSTPPTSSPTGRRGSGQAVTLAFGGDVHFERQIRSRLDADPQTALAPIKPLLGGADLAVVNLETAVTTRGTPAPGKDFTFRAPPSAFEALRAAGVDLVSMANNHGLDYGPVGLEDSLAAAKAAAFPVVGIGRNAGEAYAPYTVTIKDQRVSIIGATQVLDAELVKAWTATDSQAGLASAKEVNRLVGSVQAARRVSDTVVVYLHWGTEATTCPSSVQRPLADRLIAAGADIVVGGHAHRLLAGGRLGPAYVHYGLGNFVFYANSGPGTDSGVLTLTVTGREVDKADWAPARIEGGVARPLTGTAAAQARQRWEGLRSCAPDLTA